MAVTQQSCELSSAAADSATRPTSRLSFITDIQQMMYACTSENNHAVVVLSVTVSIRIVALNLHPALSLLTAA